MNVLVSYRVRTTGQVRGIAIAIPPSVDAHLVPTSEVLRCHADVNGLPPDEIELLDLWTERETGRPPASG